MAFKRFMRIITPTDMYGKSFVPEHVRYEVLYTHEKFVVLGIEGMEMYKMRWENVEDYTG